MSDKLTPKQEYFAQVYVETSSYTEAYIEAISKKCKRTTARVEGCKLAKIPQVAEKIKELREMHAEEHDVNVARLLGELEQARQLAMEERNAGGAVSAVMGKAKLVGLDKQVIELSGKDQAPVINLTVNKKDK